MKKLLQKSGLALGSLVLAGSSFAAGPDFTAISTAADFSTATTAIMTIAGGVVLVLVAIKGYKFITRVMN